MIAIDLAGHRALVTGASRGIGAEVARWLAQAGADLVLTARGAELGQVVEELRGEGREVRVLPLDLLNLGQTEATALREELRDVDIVVANAGVMGLYGFLEMQEENLRRLFQVNVAAHAWLIQVCLPTMLAQGWGRIIVIGSSLSGQGEAEASPDYNLSKAALQTLAKTLAKKFGAFGVTANAVAPGIIDTPMHQDWPDLIRSFIPEIPVGRLGTPADIAALVVFLASPLAAFLNGQVIHVNGGQRLMG